VKDGAYFSDSNCTEPLSSDLYQVEEELYLDINCTIPVEAIGRFFTVYSMRQIEIKRHSFQSNNK
jgi:hypothetical protein